MRLINKSFTIYKFFYVLFLLCLVNNPIQSQTLSKKQMQDDLLFLQGHIHQYFSLLPLLEKRTGINVDDEFNKLDDEITTTTSIEEFTQIIRQGLNMLYDGHSQIIPGFSLKNYASPDYYLSSIGNATLADTTNADYFYRLTTEYVNSKVKINMMTKFMKGEYYNILPFISNEIHIDTGEKISSINGMSMNQFVKDNFSKMYYLRWDPISKKPYSRLFPIALPLLGMDKFTLTIGGKDIELEVSKTVETLKKKHAQSNHGNVLLLENNILYIRIPEMIEEEWYINEFLATYTPDIEKIIIDVRANSGGYDGVWISLLQKIIDKSLRYKYHVGFNHNEAIENAIQSSFSELTMIRKGRKTEMYQDIVHLPDSNSVHFKGKIYILQDESSYSAATALASIAWGNDDIVSVGATSALIGGYTLPSIAFKLPNSGIVFTLAFATDLRGGTNNPYMDKVEVEIPEEDINTFADKILNYDCYSKEFLLTKDPLIKYVKEN